MNYSCIICHWSIGQCGLQITWLQWSNSGPSPAAVLNTTWPIRSWHPLESWTSTVNIMVMWSSAIFPPRSNVKVWANFGFTVFFFTRVFFLATRRFEENNSTLTYGSSHKFIDNYHFQGCTLLSMKYFSLNQTLKISTLGVLTLPQNLNFKIVEI